MLSFILKNSLILLLYLGETYCFVIQLTDLCSYFIHSALETPPFAEYFNTVLTALQLRKQTVTNT